MTTLNLSSEPATKDLAPDTLCWRVMWHASNRTLQVDFSTGRNPAAWQEAVPLLRELVQERGLQGRLNEATGRLEWSVPDGVHPANALFNLARAPQVFAQTDHPAFLPQAVINAFKEKYDREHPPRPSVTEIDTGGEEIPDYLRKLLTIGSRADDEPDLSR